MPSVPPTLPRGFENLRVGYGFMDCPNADKKNLEGWIFCLQEELDSVRAYLDGAFAGSAPLEGSPDIGDLFPTVPHAARSCYRLEFQPGAFKTDRVNRALVVGFHGDRPVVRISSVLFADAIVPDVPIPPADLIWTTQGNHDPLSYKALGFRYYRQLLDAVARHRDWRSIGRVLDWGCGSGRVAANFLAAPDGPRVCGCDIDAAAIAWCAANLPNGEFRLLQGFPDLPYPDASFDLIIAFAALMPFGPDELALLFPELKRVLAPKGLLVASLQGLYSAAIRFLPEVVAEKTRVGFLNGSQHDSLHPPPPELNKFYRGGFYWAPDFVAREWSKYFHVLEYGEGAINFDQDLVVMQRLSGL
jgi:SAM-dependent methyltransferase